MALVEKGVPKDFSQIDATALLTALRGVQRGDFSVRLPLDWTGVPGKVADAFNEVVELNQRLAAELERVSVVVGQSGRLDERAWLGQVGGAWASSISHVNALV